MNAKKWAYFFNHVIKLNTIIYCKSYFNYFSNVKKSTVNYNKWLCNYL